MRIMRIIGQLCLAIFLLTVFQSAAWSGCATTEFYPESIKANKKGDFIFFTSKVFEDEESRKENFDYIKRFRVCLTNGYVNFEGEDLKELHDAGSELFIYLWFDGFYQHDLLKASDPVDATNAYMKKFPDMIQAKWDVFKHPEWLLNPDEPMKGMGAVYPAYFYDFSNEEFRKHFIEFIKNRLDKTQYDGVFFDYIGGWALPSEVKSLWKKKYPQISYDDMAIKFTQELREALGSKKIFGNQAYRLSDEYYKIIDYDISESHGTSFVWGKEIEIFIEGEGIQKLIETYHRDWKSGGTGYKGISKQRRKVGDKKLGAEFFDLNYLQPWYVKTGTFAEVGDLRVPVYTKRIDRPAIFYGYSLAKLTGGSSFASDWYAPGFGKDDVYFLDLGEPVTDQFEEMDEVVIRYFENGFVVVTQEGGSVNFQPEDVPKRTKGLWDIYEGTRVLEWEKSSTVSIYPAYYPASDTFYPSGRVYMYLEN